MERTFIIVGILGGLMGLGGFLALALAYVRGSFNKATIESLRGDLGDYRAREDLHERQMDDFKAKITSLQVQVDQLSSERDFLKELALQRAPVEKLEKESKQQHAELMHAFGDLLVAVKELRAA